MVDGFGVVWEVPALMTPLRFERCRCSLDVLVVDTVLGGEVRVNDSGRLHRCPNRARTYR